VGLWLPKPGKWGALRLTTVGRRTGRERKVIIAYLEDGPNLFGMAMNGWGAAEPAWWLNLQAHPDATVECKDGRHLVRARAAEGDERTRLWALLKETDPKLDEFAAMRPTPTAIVVLEPV
jgi:deazaflavin-dependent oxidoreductase (nitroreductase family)